MVVSRRYFLERVFAGPLLFASYADIRGSSGPVMDTAFCSSIEDADSRVNNLVDDNVPNIYFGVCPRQNHRGCKSDIAYAGSAWVDIDAKAVGSKQEAYERVWNGEFARPTFLVDSGNGYHAYWCFIKPCHDLEGVEAINRYLADKVGADHCFNINRLMRVPGTVNKKDPQQPKPCRIVHYSGFIYDHDYFPRQDSPFLKVERVQAQINFDDLPPHPKLSGINQTLTGIILYGYSSVGVVLHPDNTPDRSATDFKVACGLVEAGYTDAEIATIFLTRYHGISEKAYSHGSEYQRKRYLTRTIGRARAVVEGV